MSILEEATDPLLVGRCQVVRDGLPVVHELSSVHPGRFLTVFGNCLLGTLGPLLGSEQIGQ